MRPRLGLCALIALVFGLFLLAGNALASVNDVYISQTGGSNGSSCSSPLALSYFNTPNNWTSGTPSGTNIGPGTTVHICGTWTGSAGQQFLTAQGSGVSSNPITIQFESNAIMQAPYFSGSSGAINISGVSYIIVDGGTNGVIENTLNGTSGASCLGGTCSYQQSSVAVFATNCQNCEVKNLTIQDLYVHTQCEASSGCDTGVDQTGVNAVRFSGANFLLHDMLIHDVGWALFEVNQSSDNNIQIYNNNIYNMDHGVAAGAASQNIAAEMIYNNHFHDMAAWDTGTADAYHHDGVHVFTGSSGTITNVYIYNNLFDGNQGQCCVTSWIFLESGFSTAYVFNNVLIGSNDLGYGQLGIYAGQSPQVYNNFIQGTNLGNNGSCFGFYTPGTIFENNVVEGCNQLLRGINGGGVGTFDYNLYGNAAGGNPYFQVASVSTSSFATWQSSCGCDAHSQAQLSSPLADISSEGVPSAGFAGIGAGADLGGLATGYLGPLAYDTGAGNTHTPVQRTDPWTIGAYQYVSDAPSPPTGLSATAH